MYDEVNSKHSLYWVAYFIAYVLIISLLLANLVVGVVLDSMVNFVSIMEDRTMQHYLRHGQMLEELSDLERVNLQYQKAASSFEGSQEAAASSRNRNQSYDINDSLERRRVSLSNIRWQAGISNADEHGATPSLLPELSHRVRSSHAPPSRDPSAMSEGARPSMSAARPCFRTAKTGGSLLPRNQEAIMRPPLRAARTSMSNPATAAALPACPPRASPRGRDTSVHKTEITVSDVL